MGSVYQHCPPTTSSNIKHRVEHIHPSQHPGSIYPIKTYFAVIEIIGLCHRIINFGNQGSSIEIGAIPHFIISFPFLHSPCVLQISTLKTYIHKNISIQSLVGAYYQHHFLSSHTFIKLITSWVGIHVPHDIYRILSRMTNKHT